MAKIHEKGVTMWKELKTFLMRGNVIDLAVAVIIGAAFGKVVTSLVNDVLMPPIGLILGGVDFSDLYWNLSGTKYSSLAAAKEAGAATINYGVFINNVIHFLIVGTVIFFVIKLMNGFKRQEPSAEVVMKDCPYCCSKIAEAASRCPHCTSEVK
jgi:large conductance mechanosensitive channel